MSVMTYGRKLYIGNVGDSRGIIIKYVNECKIAIVYKCRVISLPINKRS